MNKYIVTRLFTAVFICGMAILIILVLSFIFRAQADSIVSVLSLSFTAIGALATVTTLIIGILLYDRFGIKNKFIEKQTEKVIELVDELKGRAIHGKIDIFNYIIRPSIQHLAYMKQIPTYREHANKKIIIAIDDFEKGTSQILMLGRSYWMPQTIKDRLKFLDVALIFSAEDSINDYVKITFGNDSTANFSVPSTMLTFGDFNDNLVQLTTEIEKWLKTHSGLKLDLKLEEPYEHP